jgi:hypothetical protein
MGKIRGGKDGSELKADVPKLILLQFVGQTLALGQRNTAKTRL